MFQEEFYDDFDSESEESFAHKDAQDEMHFEAFNSCILFNGRSCDLQIPRHHLKFMLYDVVKFIAIEFIAQWFYDLCLHR